MTRLRIVVLGTMAGNPYAGMAWMHMQITSGFHRLGHDAYYFETTSSWPYDPLRQHKVCDSDYAVPYLKRVAESFGLDERWAYRRSYSDKEWLGMSRNQAEELLSGADLVLNVAGSTKLAEEGLEAGRLVYFGTDPVYHEITYAQGDPETLEILAEHDEVVTYGENIGTPDCPVPALPGLKAKTRQPVLIDLWANGTRARPHVTTVANWRQAGREVVFDDTEYLWSKDREFRQFLDLPQRVSFPVELATNLAPPESIEYGEGEAVRAHSVDDEDRDQLLANGWKLVDARGFTTDPWTYRDYVRASRAEFSVARDLNVRLRSGWFSERSACYLAAGRPVVAQNTGFGTVLPTGEGLFAFDSMEEALAAFEAVESDYERHARAARQIADEYFRAETVLASLLDDLGR
jgi:hypothetical protein